MRELSKGEIELIEFIVAFLLIGFVFWLMFTTDAKSQEYDCTITTSGASHYSTLDSGKTWQRVFENKFLQTTFEFPIGYECFLQTMEDTTVTYRIVPNSLKFDTMTMHLSLIFLTDWSAERELDIWFNDPIEGDKGNKLLMKWSEGRDDNLMVFEVKNWIINNIPLNLEVKKK